MAKYEDIKEFYNEFPVRTHQQECEDEIDKIRAGLKKEVLSSVRQVNNHFKSGGTAQEVIQQIELINDEVIELHTSKFLANSDQKPVQLDLTGFSLKDLMTLRDDIDIMNKKAGTESQSTGTAEGWRRFINSGYEVIDLLLRTSYIDSKHVQPGPKGRRPIDVWANETGKVNEVNSKLKALGHAEVKKENMTRSTNNSVIMTNQLQVDYCFICCLIAEEAGVSTAELSEEFMRLSMLFNQMPFTTTVLKTLIKSKAYKTLYIIEEGLKLFDSPFRVNRQRFQAAVSFLTNDCVSEKMIGGDVNSIIKKLLQLKELRKIAVSSEQNTTSFYEYTLYNVLTTPEPFSKFQNRTKVERSGLKTVVIKLNKGSGVSTSKQDEKKEEEPTDKKTSVKTPKITTPVGECPVITFKDYEFLVMKSIGSINRKDMPKTEDGPITSSRVCMFVDFEGSYGDPSEMCVILCFTNEKYTVAGVFLDHNSDSGDASGPHCSGINPSNMKTSPYDCAKFTSIKKALSMTKAVPATICLGKKDVKDLMKLLSVETKFLDIAEALPTWDDRNVAGYPKLKPGQNGMKCNSKMHNMTLKCGDDEITKKGLPHCAEADCWCMIGSLLNEDISGKVDKLKLSK
uniref:Nucleoprotein n=1 Tax=Anole arenavirus TaxID=2961771 RepID=A0A9N6YJW2_9VIRU|nr:TPA_asm: nucleoprotein [Anole arenavirus]